MAKLYYANTFCETCNMEFTKRFHIDKKSKRNYCSNDCRKKDKKSFASEWTDQRREEYSKKISGENNSNYGNKWTEKQKDIHSINANIRFRNNPIIAHECGKSNRGVKFSIDRIEKMHSHRTKESYSHTHTEESKLLIGRKSKEKFLDPDFNRRYRKTMEDRGWWVPSEQKDPYELYYKESDWIENMVEFFDEAERKNLSEHGFYNKGKITGFVRDHILPRIIGWEYKIEPQLLRHPANLQFITNGANITKGFIDRQMSAEQKYKRIQELYERIKNFNRKWKEHNICLEILKRKGVSDV